jgi:DNA invertase Pin-like site-specific DNA recombinase
MMTMLAAFADFERSMIRERQREGIDIAKARGDTYKGRAPKLNADQIAALRAALASGTPKAEAARAFAISRPTLDRYVSGFEK